MKATIDQVARRALELIRQRHNYKFAIMHAVFEVSGDDQDFWKVLPVLRRLLANDHALRFVYRKITRALESSSEPEELQTCFHGIVHAVE